MLQQALRFGAVGLTNTLFGMATIFVALAVGFGDYGANALGYAVGLSIGFLMNRRWTFDATMEGNKREQLALYVVAFAISYSANLAVLTVLRSYTIIPAALAQCAAMLTYTLCFFALCRAMVFAPPKLRLGAKWSLPDVALLAVALLGIPFVAGISLSHDVVWQLWIARQIAHGAELYVDILEVNPPLWFWMGLGVQRLSWLLNLSPYHVLVLGVWLWAAASAWFVGRLCPELGERKRTALVLFIFAVCTLMPINDYGQREHLVLIAGIPYALLLAARARGIQPRIGILIAVSIAAAFAFALKHFFVLFPLLGEIWLLLQLRRDYRPIRTETSILVALAALYCAAVVFLTPGFFTNLVPMVNLAYDDFGIPFLRLFQGYEIILWLVIFLYALQGSYKNENVARTISEILMIFFFSFFLSYLIQQKGFQYHRVPVTGGLIILLFSTRILSISDLSEAKKAILPIVLCIAPLVFGVTQGPYSNANEKKFAMYQEGMAPGSSFLAIVTNPSRIWPMVEAGGYKWPSRYFSFWMIPAVRIHASNPQPNPALQRLGLQVVRETVQDMRCNPPRRVMIEVRPTKGELRALGFRMEDLFNLDPEFVDVMSHYRQVERNPEYVLYEQKTPYGAPNGARCRILY